MSDSLHGTILKEKYNTKPFGFCNERVHSNPLQWEVISDRKLETITGYRWSRFLSTANNDEPEAYWIFFGSFQVSAQHNSKEFLESIIKEAQSIYLASI